MLRSAAPEPPPRAALGAPAPRPVPLLHRVHLNRALRPAVWRSRVTVKADAATGLFGLSCRGLRWAVVDSGVDATHPAFARAGGAGAASSRVVATLDFTRLRGLFARAQDDRRLTTPEEEELDELQRWLDAGRSVDWSQLAAKLTIPHDAGYTPPGHEHGTHVAGVLAARWTQAEAQAGGMRLEQDVTGICPDL